jgi:hypothetical protein
VRKLFKGSERQRQMYAHELKAHELKEKGSAP